MINKRATFANLVVKFGRENLLDYKELFTSALMVDTKYRKYGRSLYRFMDVKLQLADPNDPLSVVIFGRFVKDTEYIREQVLADGKLVADEKALPVALSSFFCIFLAEHRMAYVPEVRNAPPLDAFASTLEHYLRKEFTSLIDSVYREQKAQNPKFTRANAIAGRVSPVVHIVPLPARQSVREFVSRFEKITSMTVTLIHRNNEISRGLFQAIIKEIEPTGAATAKLVATGGTDGLDIEGTANFVEETTESGYENVTLKGIDKDGSVLKGGNEEYKLTADVHDGLPDQALAVNLFARYKNMASNGQLKVGERSQEETDAIAKHLSSLIRAAE
ncbi:hypothetical protein MCELHM10_00379 [Paracoccaceae bacterium]